MIILSVLVGLAGLGNYSAIMNNIYSMGLGIVIQGALVGVAITLLLLFRGKKTRASYSEWGVRYFTIGFAIRLISMFGNLAIFIVVLLNLLGIISGF